ncbi:MAG: hypothetical protein SGBAC_011485 [Bacillariaceae sp.]
MSDITLAPPVTPPATAITIDHHQSIVDAFESLNKWKTTVSETTKSIPSRLVFSHNKSKAAGKGFPTVLDTGRRFGLTDHEIAALFGYTTGDYRFVNPIARGQGTVEFDDYPWLPQDFSKIKFVLTRDEVRPCVHMLSAALSKLQQSNNSSLQRAWRGHKRPLPNRTGQRFVLEGFGSATLDRDTALEFCIKTDGEVTKQNAKRTLIGIVQSTGGTSISKFSARPQEMEVLFPPNTAFEVVDPPSEDSSEEDTRAVKDAVEKLQKNAPDATIELLYVKEVSTTNDGEDTYCLN